MIFKKNNLLGGTWSLQDFLLPTSAKNIQADIYSKGAQGIQAYLQAFDSGNPQKQILNFERAMAGVDQRIVQQARSLQDNQIELQNYANNLRNASESLQTVGTSFDAVSIKAKAANFAFNAVNVAVSTLISTVASMVVSFAIEKIADGVDYLVNYSKNITEAAEAAEAAVVDFQSSYKSIHDTVLGTTGDNGIAQEFANLAQGVNRAGDNVSLTSSQYERYLELSNQLADIFPTLTRHYDSNGNAILDLSGDVETIVEQLNNFVVAAQRATNSDILSQAATVFADVNQQIVSAQTSLLGLESPLFAQIDEEALKRNYQDAANSIQNDGNLLSFLSDIISPKQRDLDDEGVLSIPFQITPETDMVTATREIEAAMEEIGVEILAQGLDGQTLTFDIAESDLPKVQANLNKLVWSLDPESIAQYQQVLNEQIARLQPYIQAALQENVSYGLVSENFQGEILRLAADQSIVDLASYKNDYEGWANAIQTDVLDPITEMASSEAGPALEQLLGLSDNYDINQSAYLGAVEDLRALITAGYEAVGEEVPESITKLFDSMEEEHVAAFQAYSARLGSAGVDLANLEAVNLSMMQQKILGSIDTTAEQQLFSSVTTDTQTVAEQIRSYQAAIASASAIDAFEGIKESADSFAEYQTTVQEALTTGQLTVEQYESLIAIAPEYADALEMQGQQITLNAEKTQELVAARNEEIASDAKAQRSKARVAYIRNAAVLEDLIDQYNKLSDAERQSQQGMALSNQIDNLIAQQNELSNVANKYALIEAQMSEVAQAYKNYEAAMNYASPEDHWEIGYGALEDLNEGLNSGKMGTAEFQAALDLAIPDDVYKDLETEAEQGQAVADYVSNVLNPFFTEDEVTGMQRFLDEAVKLGALEKSFDENGVAEYATKADITWEEFADTMGMTVPMLEAMIGLFDAYDFDGQAFRESLDMAGLSEDTKEYLDLLEKQNDLYAERQELVKDSSIDLNGPEIAAIDEQLAANSEQISESAQGLTVDIEARLDLESNIADTEKEISSLKDSLNSVEKGSDEYIEIQSNIAEKRTELDGYVRELDKLGGTPTEVEIEIALGVWEQQLATAKADLESFLSSNEGNYEVNVDGSFTFDNSALQEEYNGLVSNISAIEQNIEVHVSADTDEADTGLDDMNQKLVEIQDNIDKVSSTGITIKGVTTSVENLGKIQTAASNAASEISGLSQEIINMPSAKTTTITTRYVSEYSTSYSGGKSSKSGVGRGVAQGTAHAYGTARAKGTDLFPSNWKLKRPELALTGELGPEMVVRGNEWFLAGENGTEFNQLQKGDIVFNHLQTEQLLNKGAIRGRGKARLQGTLPEEGLALVTGSFSFRKYQTSNWSGGSSGSSSSSTEASYNYNGSGGSSGSSDEDDFRETIDWVEKELDRLQRKIDQTAITAESAYKTFSERNKALASEYDQITNKMEENRKGIARYEAEADSVGLSESYAKLVRDGTIDIETITDEDLKDKIDQYTEWYFLMPLYLVTGGGYSVELLESPKGSQATAQR